MKTFVLHAHPPLSRYAKKVCSGSGLMRSLSGLTTESSKPCSLLSEPWTTSTWVGRNPIFDFAVRRDGKHQKPRAFVESSSESSGSSDDDRPRPIKRKACKNNELFKRDIEALASFV
mmetsp:Transcript_31739/g.50961  ORF Transcript_31739/g.50961 Transcript_31739/m.50961 type:complete len:117 (-) Transcript_31739:39-389(-)